METPDQLRRQLRAVEDKLAEARLRLPAHSAKPAHMTELIDLEDERDRLLDRIAELSGNAF